ncbi:MULTISPECIES: transposase family protein [unclassified Streptomyces]|uniref:transposase family protein n=1 Tax=unclassified Streptomyces TaxID=2593676 RepID=UPI00225BA857|nr:MULTISPECIES: transposase family protein [unclassified Streptomyces]MCX5055420.1 transposase family protein [Streptomyces sp. NBC_00474]
MRWPVPAAASSPIPAVLVKLGPLDTGRIADLRPYFDSVPDPRARRGRWYSFTAILLVCACAAVSGARSIDELAEWGQRASNAVLTVIGIRRHLLRWRRAPASATIGRALGAVDGDALDRAVGACLADRHRAATQPAQAPSPSASGRSRAIAVDAKHSRDQPVSPRRAGICSPRSPTAPSCPSPRWRSARRRTKPRTSGRCWHRWT